MNTRHYEEIFERFKLYHPYMVDRVVDFRPRGDKGIRLKLNDGSRYDYDIVGDFLRRVKSFVVDDARDINDEECREALARNLQEQMRLKGYTQTTLAHATGLSQSMIHNYVNAKSTASSTALRRMAMVLECTIDELLI